MDLLMDWLTDWIVYITIFKSSSVQLSTQFLEFHIQELQANFCFPQ